MAKYYFAWAGGAIPPPFSLVTTGDTHGGTVLTIATTADLATGSAVLGNFAAASQLTTGQLYGVAGAGIPVGAVLVVEAGGKTATTTTPSTFAPITATGLTGYLTGSTGITPTATTTTATGTTGPTARMDTSATITARGQTLSITKPITVALTQGTTSSGSAVVVLADVGALVFGTLYGIIGPGIPTGALFTYYGGTSVQLRGINGSSLGATAGGTVGVTISGLPNAASDQVTNVANLTGLTQGLQYDISGPGIPAGATFIAPSGDSTTLALDQAATATVLGASLTITGPHVLDAAFDPTTMAREDEEVFALTISQKEGDFAQLQIDIRNPDVGLLATGRQEWCWLSWDQNEDGNVVPLFNGRLVGVPQRLTDEIVQLIFVAQPDNYAAAKAALADTMRVAPWWDPIWIRTGTDDPDTVLESRAQLWDVDRVTLAVTASDIVLGEAGPVVFDETQHFYEGLDVSYRQPPLTQIAVTGTVSWTQTGSGSLDLTPQIVDLFEPIYPFPIITTMTGDGLKSQWPSPGRSLGGGWSMGQDSYIQKADWVAPYGFNITFTGKQDPVPGANDVQNYYLSQIVRWTITFSLSAFAIYFPIEYKASRKRTERVSFTLTADVQKVLSQPAGADAQTLDLSSQYVDQPVDPGGQLPIGDVRRNAYFATDRGLTSFQYLLLLARAKMLARARCVRVKFATTFDLAQQLSCRHAITLLDRRLPNGAATGKVVEYSLMADDQGAPHAEVTIACTIGHGGSIAPVAGTEAYADDYADAYQAATGGTDALASADITYEPLTDFPVDDDGIDLLHVKASHVIQSLTIANPPLTQVEGLTLLQSGTASTPGIDPGSVLGNYTNNPITWLKQHPTQMTLVLKSVSGVSFHTDYLPWVSEMVVPKTIDLEAGSQA